MKEYITLINFTKMSLSGKTSDAIVVNYYKDYDRTILHREKNKPAVIYSGRIFSYHTIGNSFRHKKI